MEQGEDVVRYAAGICVMHERVEAGRVGHRCGLPSWTISAGQCLAAKGMGGSSGNFRLPVLFWSRSKVIASLRSSPASVALVTRRFCFGILARRSALNLCGIYSILKKSDRNRYQPSRGPCNNAVLRQAQRQLRLPATQS